MSEAIYGKNVVKEALEQKRVFHELYVTENNTEILELAKKNAVKFQIVTKEFLSVKTKELHQGVYALVEEYRYYEFEEVIPHIKKVLPLVLILDGLEDPHNLGAILRSCDALGVDAVVLPKNRSVKLNSTVAKVSTGAIEHVKVIEVVNIVNTLNKLKKMGYWIVGAEASKESVDFRSIKYDMPTALIIGSEGNGLAHLTTKNCDFLVKIPMVGHVNSLNASVSCGILLSEIVRYRS